MSAASELLECNMDEVVKFWFDMDSWFQEVFVYVLGFPGVQFPLVGCFQSTSLDAPNEQFAGFPGIGFFRDRHFLLKYPFQEMSECSL